MYFDGIQQDLGGYTSVDGGIVVGAFFRRAAREQNDAMRSICSFVEVVLTERIHEGYRFRGIEGQGFFFCAWCISGHVVFAQGAFLYI